MSHVRDLHRAFTILEVIICLVILSIVGVAAAVGLQGLSHDSDQMESGLWTSQQLAQTLESLRDTTYASLASGSKTSEANRLGQTFTITWTVTEIDPITVTSVPPTTKSGTGLKQIIAKMNSQTLTMWVTG